jgi:membrane-associated protease RseP (regulator of RpoE activity)
VRVKDPFDEIDVNKRKAVLYTGCGVMLIVAYAIVFPTQLALVAMIFAFIVMIMLHEFGHFITAKRAGMKVTEFFVGFGPRLWSVQRGETEYGIKAIPLGGYCKVIGMTNLEEVAPEDEPRAYRSKRWGPKVVMAAAGPAVHFIIAIVLLFCVLFFAGDYRNQHQTTTLAKVEQGAQAAGLQAGDEIVAIDGTKVRDWSQVSALIKGSDGQRRVEGDTVRFVVQRGEQVLDFEVTLRQSADAGPKRIVAGVVSRVNLPRPGLVASVAAAPRQVGEIGWESVKALGSMFSPSGISNYFRILSGDESKSTDQSKRFVSPVGFGQLANNAVKSGWVTAFGLLIAINIFVGLFNLLPLLPFDGGHIAVATYEQIASRIRRRRVQVDMAKLMPLTVGVLAVLAFIFLSSLFLDITHPVANPF